MREGLFLAFDVGGTYIKAGAMDTSGHILSHTLLQYESKANLSADQIIEHFVAIVTDILLKADPEGREQIKGIGYAFPGPFDYEQGISYIQGLNKYESLFGLNVSDMVKDKLKADPHIAARLSSEFKLRFENDAAMFALGEAHYGQASGSERAVILTIGTGIGSGFIEKGRLVKQRQGIPDNGWVYQLPYGIGIADDYLSRRGLLGLAMELGIELNGEDVKELAESASCGNPNALLVFEMFGKRLAEILGDTLRTFSPNIIVLGGQISKSGELFTPSFARELNNRGVTAAVALSHDTLKSTLLGIYHLLC